MPDVKPIPDGRHTLTPYLVVSNAAEALEFYKTAFGAEELARMPTPDGKQVMHAELKIGDSTLMLCDELAGSEQCLSPKSLSGTSVSLHLWSDDVDAAFGRAVKAGATVSMPVTDMFWGDRYGKVVDPFGHVWGMATHVKDLTPAEIAEAAKDFFSRMDR